jgi:serine/threonine protein kinase
MKKKLVLTVCFVVTSVAMEPMELSVKPTRPTIFEPTSGEYTNHPHFVGVISKQTYDIWEELTEKEADLLKPLTSMTISNLRTFTLGGGHYGIVRPGRNLQTKGIYAIKIVSGEEAINASLQEGELVHFLKKHPHIMPLEDYLYDKASVVNKEPRVYQVMPVAYINGIGFKKMLTHSSNGARERIVFDSFWQMMMGLDYIHKKGMVHLDIKEDNTLYMKDGTLRIADFGKAKKVDDNDQIADMNNLGDSRTFSPEIMAFIRKCKGGSVETVDSFSGKGADVWAAGLYIWELLEDNADNLFSIQREIPLIQRAEYWYKTFEEFVKKIDSLNETYSETLLNLLRQVLTVNPATRAKTSDILRNLNKLSADNRKAAFEEVIRLANQDSTPAEEHPTAVAEIQPLTKVDVPNNDDMYPDLSPLQPSSLVRENTKRAALTFTGGCSSSNDTSNETMFSTCVLQ